MRILDFQLKYYKKLAENLSDFNPRKYYVIEKVRKFEAKKAKLLKLFLVNSPYNFLKNNQVNFVDFLGLDNCCSQSDGTVDEGCCLDKCGEVCGGNHGCILACFDKCASGEVPNGLEYIEGPTAAPPIPPSPSTGTDAEGIGEIISNLIDFFL